MNERRDTSGAWGVGRGASRDGCEACPPIACAPSLAPHARRRTAHPRHAHRRGVVIMLVVVVLVMLAMLGATYIQVTRVQRLGVKTYDGDVDTALESVIILVDATLVDDLMDEDGEFFNQQAGANNTGYDEPYDYDWVNDNPGVNNRPVTGIFTGINHNPIGGEFDDPWMASPAPEFDTDGDGVPNGGGDTPWWPQITSLTGYYLESTNGASPADLASGLSDTWNEQSVTGTLTSNANSQSNWELRHTDGWGGFNTLVDTDLDGLGDARWEMTPVVQIGGVVYVMAVRIVDVSSMVNANVALGLTNGAGAYDAFADAPDWRYPSELDLAQFARAFPSGSNAEVLALLRHRLGDLGLPDTIVPLDVDPGVDRLEFWLNGARRYGSFSTGVGNYKSGSGYNSLTVTDEWELRRHGGLGDAAANTGELKLNMPTMLAVRTPITGMADAIRYYSPTGLDTVPAAFMTVSSGSAIFAPRLTSDTDDRVLKLDVNDATADELREAILDVFNAGTPTLPAGLNSLSINQFAEQFAANIVDYADADNELTQVGNFYGMEDLPFVVEVYTQAIYDMTALATGNPDEYDITWTRKANNLTGYAIEIRSPFKFPVDLTTVELHVGGSNWGTLDQLAGQNTLAPDEVLVLYRKSNNDANPEDDVTQVFEATEAGLTYIEQELTTASHDWPGGDVDVELRATVGPPGGGGTIAAWAYSSVPSTALPDTVTQSLVIEPAGDPSGFVQEGYGQRWSIGNADGLDMMTEQLTSGDVGGVVPTYVPQPGPQTPLDTVTPQIRATNKNGAPAGKLGAGPDGRDGQIVLSNAGRLNQIGEVAHVFIHGPDPSLSPATVAQAWPAGASALSDFMLDFNPATAGTVTPLGLGGSFEIPHAVLLLERLTTMSPQVDSENNDGDSDTDEDDETFIPGTLNLNTASRIVLEGALPISDLTLRQDIVQAIIDYRQATGATRGGAGYRAEPGIAHAAELLLPNTLLTDPNGLDTGFNYFATTHGGDSYELPDTTGGGMVHVDFLANDPNAVPEQDGVADDREEQAMIGRWLMQVGSTRSDTYVAYIYVLGFPADDFMNGPVESARAIVLFNRSGVDGPGDSAEVARLRLQ